MPSFDTFSTVIRASTIGPNFRDLLTKAESHELFLKSLHGSVTPPIAFTAQEYRQSNNYRVMVIQTTPIMEVVQEDEDMVIVVLHIVS